jgi:hypothetical protein
MEFHRGESKGQAKVCMAQGMAALTLAMLSSLSRTIPMVPMMSSI